ncbi:hypothetical protein ABZY31_22725 [Streptomyces sp. NPDC006529]|uniref:hypothetical protein n=1 Tax=Streptomyces sp. NPDC006529 TaxID=3157177 RepID=UPI00339FCE11
MSTQGQQQDQQDRQEGGRPELWQEHWYEPTGEEFAAAGHEVPIPNFPEPKAWWESAQAAAPGHREVRAAQGLRAVRKLREHDSAAERAFAARVAGAGASRAEWRRGAPVPVLSPEVRRDRSLRAAAGAIPRIRG